VDFRSPRAEFALLLSVIEEEYKYNFSLRLYVQIQYYISRHAYQTSHFFFVHTMSIDIEGAK